MTAVYILQSGNPSYIEPLREVAQLLRHSVVEVVQPDTLAQYKHEEGVVILSGEADHLNAQVGSVRSLVPLMSCLIAAKSNKISALPDDVLALADVLPIPLETRETYARLNSALHTSELRRLIAEQAHLDEVTELFNTPYFLKRLGEEISLSKRHLSPVTIVILGIAYYDVFMDSYGYQFICRLMKHVAQVAGQHVRKEDIVARLGDSEIGLLLPRSTEKGALTVTQRIVQQIERTPFYMGDQEEHLSVNAGIASYPVPDEDKVDADTLVRYGRHALHTARCSEDSDIQLFASMKPRMF